MKEVTVGFLREIHLDATLKSDLREDLNLLLATVPLKPDETIKLTKEKPVEDDEMNEMENEIVIPAYDLVNNNFGFGNSSKRITTRAIEIRFDPEDANILKKLLT